MRVPIFGFHIMRQKTLERKLRAHKSGVIRQTNRQVSTLLYNNAWLAARLKRDQ